MTIEVRRADGRADRLPGLAADLVRHRVAVIAALANAAAVAARDATTTIPIVFTIGGDPVKIGLVGSLNRPSGNITGVSFLSSAVMAKMLEVLHAVVPNTAVIAALVNPDNPQSEADTRDAQDAARTLGLQLHVLSARTEGDINTAFEILVQHNAGGLLIEGDPFFATAAMKQPPRVARLSVASHCNRIIGGIGAFYHERNGRGRDHSLIPAACWQCGVYRRCGVGPIVCRRSGYLWGHPSPIYLKIEVRFSSAAREATSCDNCHCNSGRIGAW